ncbi:hypothetical protein Scep_007357 [Stephania cephalantha]|uniref:Uncharacterized protein n=1 Tax=Stephania cephalantha TaxID=152367 RepID=A0AAP0PNR7_9MAGN
MVLGVLTLNCDTAKTLARVFGRFDARFRVRTVISAYRRVTNHPIPIPLLLNYSLIRNSLFHISIK